jgi:hypothetical protein
MTNNERELLLIVARICSEGRGQEGSRIMDLADKVRDAGDDYDPDNDDTRF